MKNLKALICVALALVLSLSILTPIFAVTPDEVYTPNEETEEDLFLITSFADVKSSAWYYTDVTNCAKLGIVAGFEDGKFHPDENVTGIQFATMLTRTFYNAELEKITTPAGEKWYYPYLTVAKNVGMTSTTLSFTESNLNRYDMAQAAYNIIAKKGKQLPVTGSEYKATETSIPDYKSIPSNRLTAVRQTYALGIITGMDGGYFNGSQYMTRAQACTVIMRMLKLINNYQPGDLDNDQYDDGTSQNPTATLPNGKPLTTENVLAIMEEIKAKYPTGTPYKTTFCSYKESSTDVGALINKWKAVGGASVGLQSGCAGYARMISDTIFGTTGFPAREITNPKVSDIRPGDIVIKFTDDGKYVAHVLVIWKVQKTNGVWYYNTTQNASGNGVSWPNTVSNTGIGTKYDAVGENCRIFTRYPD